MNTRRKNETEKLLGGQKLVYQAISVPLSKDEIELLIEGLCDMSITNRRAICLYQKLAKKLEALEGARENDNDAR